MGFHRERAAAGLGPSGLTVVLWLWKKGLPWKFIFVLYCSIKLGFFFQQFMCVDSVTVTPVILLCTFTSVIRRMTLDRLFLFVFIQWFRLECSYLFHGWGWIVLTCSLVEAGVFLFTGWGWSVLTCSLGEAGLFFFSGSGWIALTCSMVQVGLFRLVKACSPKQVVDNTRAGITHWCLFLLVTFT